MNTSGTRNAAEMVAELKKRALEKAALQNNNMSPVFREWAERASIKSERGNSTDGAFFVPEGAHPLSIRSREKLLNRCAPVGADNASSEVGSSDFQLREKGHAGAHSHLTTASEEPATSPCSSADKEEVVNGCADMTPDDDDQSQQRVDFYEIKTDLFDNSKKGKKTTVHRAKLMIRNEPTTYAKDADVFMLDFYNRSRDINKRLAEMEVQDDPWYVEFKATFDKYSKMLVQYEIAPKIAVLKEINKDDGSADIIGYGAGIMFQVPNQEPTVILFYGASKFEMQLDFEFNRTPGSPVFKKGIRRDPARQHADVELVTTKKKFKIKTAKDFN